MSNEGYGSVCQSEIKKYLDQLSILLHTYNRKMQSTAQLSNYLDNLGALVKCAVKWPIIKVCTHDASHDRVIKLLSNGLICDVVHHTKAMYKCTISWCIISRKIWSVYGYLYKYSQNRYLAHGLRGSASCFCVIIPYIYCDTIIYYTGTKFRRSCRLPFLS